MKEFAESFIKMIEDNPVPGPHRFGPFTDTILAMVKRAGNTYESYFKVSSGKLVSVKPFPTKFNPVMVMIAPYLASYVGKSPFAKAEAEYLLQKIKKELNPEQYEMGNTMISNYDEFTEKEREEYQQYKKMFANL